MSGIVITLLLAASVAVNVWFFMRAPAPGKQSVRSTLIQGIKNVKELTTLRQHFQSVVIFKDSKALFGMSLPGTERKFILKYGGVIVCGSDLENIQITERFSVNRVRIVVPRSKILDIYADMRSVQVYDQSAGLFTSIELSDQNREIVKNLEEVRQDAVNSDILRRADDNTRALLTTLAASLGMEAEVEFDAVSAVDAPEPLIEELKALANTAASEPEPVMIKTVADEMTAIAHSDDKVENISEA